MQKDPLFISSAAFSQSRVLKIKTGLRPYREGGIRFECEKIEGKWVIHHYGHGGSGTSLSWGSAEHVLHLFQNSSFYEEKMPLAVLGAGVIGLTTAYKLKQAGHPVTIYSKQFSSETTSAISPAIWNVFLVERGKTQNEIDTFEKIVSLSFQKFKYYAEEKGSIFQGISFLPIYSFNLREVHDPFLDPYHGSGEMKTAFFENGLQKDFLKYSTFLIDNQVYLNDLENKLKQAGVLYAQKDIMNVKEIKYFLEPVVFNCTGYASRFLFQDTSLKAIKGHLIDLDCQNRIPAMLSSGSDEEGIDFYWIPVNGKIILGGNYEENEDLEPNLMISGKILNRAKYFFAGLL